MTNVRSRDNWKIYISTDTRFMTTRLDKILSSGKMIKTQKFKSPPTSCSRFSLITDSARGKFTSVLFLTGPDNIRLQQNYSKYWRFGSIDKTNTVELSDLSTKCRKNLTFHLMILLQVLHWYSFTVIFVKDNDFKELALFPTSTS